MFCIGNSHMACVLAAAERAGSPLDAVVLKENGKYVTEAVGRQFPFVHPRDLSEELPKIHVDGPVFSFIGGTRHAVMRFRRNPRPYDVYLPSAPDLPIEDGAEIIPVNALRTSLAASMLKHLRALETVIEVGSGPVFHLEPPPPPAVSWWEASDRASQDAPFLRYKLWRLNSEIVRELVERLGGTFIESPTSAKDEDGLLRPELVHNSTHANAAYGALVLEQMRSVA